jgi:hypothetical protein
MKAKPIGISFAKKLSEASTIPSSMLSELIYCFPALVKPISRTDTIIAHMPIQCLFVNISP